MQPIFEVSASSIESCYAAKGGGARRVELCSDFRAGGVTPSYGLIKKARELLDDVRLIVKIRPRLADFLYTEYEVEQMEDDIACAADLGADGVSFGCLNRDGYVDIAVAERLIRAAGPLETCFGRAFDVCRDPKQAVEELAALGVRRILSSGRARTAPLGAKQLARIVTDAAGRIEIMAGGGITPRNIRSLARISHVTQFHFSAKAVRHSLMRFQAPPLFGGGTPADAAGFSVTDEATVRKTVTALG